MSLPSPEFLESYAALVQMPESENPGLHKRLRQLIERMYERRAEWERMGRPRGVDMEYSREDCPECTPEEPCFAHGLYALVAEYRKTKE